MQKILHGIFVSFCSCCSFKCLLACLPAAVQLSYYRAALLVYHDEVELCDKPFIPLSSSSSCNMSMWSGVVMVDLFVAVRDACAPISGTACS